jgi:hypothetical protein
MELDSNDGGADITDQLVLKLEIQQEQQIEPAFLEEPLNKSLITEA